MRLLRLVLVVAGLVGVVLVARALTDRQAEPASLDTWPAVPRKPGPGVGA